MATFDDRSYVKRLIAAGGRVDPENAPDNPYASRIVEYENMEGRTAWGVVFEGDGNQHRYEEETEYVHNPRVIWKRNADEG